METIIIARLILEETQDLVSCDEAGVVVRTEFHNEATGVTAFDTVIQGDERYLASLISGAYIALRAIKLNNIEAEKKYQEHIKQEAVEIAVKCNAIVAALADPENETWQREVQRNNTELSAILTRYTNGEKYLNGKWW